MLRLLATNVAGGPYSNSYVPSRVMAPPPMTYRQPAAVSNSMTSWGRTPAAAGAPAWPAAALTHTAMLPDSYAAYQLNNV